MERHCIHNLLHFFIKSRGGVITVPDAGEQFERDSILFNEKNFVEAF